MEKLIRKVNELKAFVASLDQAQKNEIVRKHGNFGEILFGRPHYLHSVNEELILFEKKFDITLSKELKNAFDLVGVKGFSFNDLLNPTIAEYYPVETVYSEKFIKLLIENNINTADFYECDYDHSDKSFISDKIGQVYEACNEKEDLLIHFIGFNESCGGRSLLILNGPDENFIADDNYGGSAELYYKGNNYKYESYLLAENGLTIFDVMNLQVDSVVGALKEYVSLN